MKNILFIIYFLFCVNLNAQKLYAGNSNYYSDIVINNGYVYRGNSTYSSNSIYYFDGTYLYKSINKSKYSSNIIGTYKNGKIYYGRSTYSSDILATYKNNKMYQGNSTYSSNIIFTYKNNKIYNGNSTYYSDILCSTSGYIHPIILFFILLR